MMKNKCVQDLSGTQFVRLIDVFILAPIMIKASTASHLSETQKDFLFLAGVGTAVFNGVNFVRNLE